MAHSGRMESQIRADLGAAMGATAAGWATLEWNPAFYSKKILIKTRDPGFQEN